MPSSPNPAPDRESAVNRYAQRLYEAQKAAWEWSWAYANESTREEWRDHARRELRAIGL